MLTSGVIGRDVSVAFPWAATRDAKIGWDDLVPARAETRKSRPPFVVEDTPSKRVLASRPAARRHRSCMQMADGERRRSGKRGPHPEQLNDRLAALAEVMGVASGSLGGRQNPGPRGLVGPPSRQSGQSRLGSPPQSAPVEWEHPSCRLRGAGQQRFGYDLNRSVDDIRPSYGFDVSCQGTVPEAIIAFLDSESYEDAVRNAVSLGGDSDTLACIAGGIAEAFYGGVPTDIRQRIQLLLPHDLWGVPTAFCGRFARRAIRPCV